MKEGPRMNDLGVDLKVKDSSRHLNEGVSPIMACVWPFENLEVEHPKHSGKLNNNFSLSNLKDLDWRNGTYGCKREDCITAGSGTFVMSAVDDSNKFSQGFHACTGLIVTGIDKKTGKNISFMTHQPPFSSSPSFGNGLNKRFIEMQERCKSGTIDAVIVGGRYRNDEMGASYIKMIKLLATKTQQFFGFEPTVINGPKTKEYEFEKEYKHHDNAYYDNEHRRLYFVRPKVNSNTKDFVPSRVDGEKGRWTK